MFENPEPRDSDSQSRFILTWRIQPPANTTVLARSGGSYFDAAYSPLQKQWFMLCGGREEKIEPPTFWRLTPAVAARLDQEALRAAGADQEAPRPQPCTRKGQFLFDLSDSGTPSGRAGQAHRRAA